VRLIPKFLRAHGTLPEAARMQIATEGQLFLEEGLRGTESFRQFSAPGRRASRAIRRIDVGIGISEKRVLLFEQSGRRKIVDLTYDDPRRAALEVSLDEDRVVIGIDLDRFGTPDVHGEMTIRFKSPNAALIVDTLQSRLGAQ
jgi:hypothetical protein